MFCLFLEVPTDRFAHMLDVTPDQVLTADRQVKVIPDELLFLSFICARLDDRLAVAVT